MIGTMGTTALAQLLQTSNFRENLSMINPAAIDIEYLKYKVKYNLGARHQHQFVGFQDGNEQQFSSSLYADFIPKKSAFLWGGSFQYDQISALQYIDFKMRGAVSLELASKRDFLSVGISLGAGLLNTRFGKINLEDAFDPTIMQFSDGVSTNLYPNAGVGLYYYHYAPRGNIYYFGASLPNAVPNTITFGDTTTLSITTLQHFSLQAGFRTQLRTSSYFEINTWMKRAISNENRTDFPSLWNVFAKYHFKDVIWVGSGGSFSLPQKEKQVQNIAGTYSGIIAFGVDLSYLKTRTLIQLGLTYHQQFGRFRRDGMSSPEIFIRVSKF
jgi:type IX secretion system PorP/SprF family membrane protein